jgi:hypothetical protein
MDRRPVDRAGRPRFLSIVALVATFACGGRVAEPERTTIVAAVVAYDPYGAPMARFRVGQHPVLYELGPDDFLPIPYAIPATDRLTIPSQGVLPVRASLVTTEGDTLATASVTFELQPGYQYGVRIHAGETRPNMQGFCYFELLPAPVRRPGNAHHVDGDTMFLMHGSVPPYAGLTCP